MATEIIEKWICDISGDEASTTEEFSVGGHSFEIDLSEEWEIKFRQAFGFWMDRARRIGRKPSGAPPKDKPGVQVNHGKARKWAESNGIPVNAHGAVPKEVIDAYVQAWLKDEVPEQWR